MAMINTEQRVFEVKFGVDQRVQVSAGQFKGSKGYIDTIKISRNGIFVEVVLTEIVNHGNISDKNHFGPKIIKVPESMLESKEG